MSTTTQTDVTTGTWSLDGVHSSIGFTVQYMGVAPFRGAFRDVTATLEDGVLAGTARAASIDVDNDDLAAHLASPEFFDVERHPELSFTGTLVSDEGDRVTVEGSLEIKGVTAPVTLTGTASGPVADPFGNTKLALELSGSVDRTTVGLTWNAPLPDGGTMLADEVELSASLLFVRSEA